MVGVSEVDVVMVMRFELAVGVLTQFTLLVKTHLTTLLLVRVDELKVAELAPACTLLFTNHW